MTILAHGAGDLGALGVPIPLLLLLAAGTVPALAGALSARAAQALTPRPPPRHLLLPGWLRALLNADASRTVARGAALTAFAVVVAVAGVGSQGITDNPAPRLILYVSWGLTVAASVLFGPVVKLVSPLRTIAAWLGRLVGRHRIPARDLPERVGVWPAAGALTAWAIAAEVLGAPRPVLAFLLAYAAPQVAAGLWYGQGWFARGETFEVYSTLLASLSPLCRDAQGRLGLRSPLASLARLRLPSGAAGLIAVVLGWEVAHAVRSSDWWSSLLADLGERWEPLLTAAAVLVAVAAAGLLVRAATPRRFLVVPLIPVAAGWSLAHHVAVLTVDAPGVVAVAELVALLGGALLSVAAAHRMAVARYDLRAARAVQFPLRAVLILLILVGLGLQGAAV